VTAGPAPASGDAPAFDLSGRVVVLTGAAGILGAHFAAALAASGAALALVDRDPAALAALAARLPAAPAGAHLPLAADLADRAGDAPLIARVADAFGRPADGLVNNAASKSSSLDAFLVGDMAFAPETWRAVFAVNLEAPFFLSRAFAAPLLAAGRPGAVVNVASIYGHMAPDQRIYRGSRYLDREISSPAAYSASKAGLLGLTRHLAALWGAQGVRVNSLAPGGVDSGQNEVFARAYSARVPLGRMAQPQDMTGLLVFLLSDAARYVTGQNMLVDGGLSAW
jgi:NAD(P)-dependent dehydrogenase (short-subunit alcohol dehydrogenase family)